MRRVPWLVPAVLHAIQLVLGLVVLAGLSRLAHIDLLWAQVSFIVVTSEVCATWSAALTRMMNTVIGCAVGLLTMVALGPNVWAICVAIVVVALVCSAYLGPPARWKIAPVTTLIVMTPALVSGSLEIGIERGLLRFGEVVAGSLLAVVLSLAFSRIHAARFEDVATRPTAHGAA